MRLLEAMAPILVALKDAGVTANIDPSRLNPPCAWVTPGSAEPAFLNGDSELTCEVWLVVPDTGVFDTYAALEKLLTKALTVLTPDGPIEMNTGIEMSNNKVLPAFKFPIIVRTK